MYDEFLDIKDLLGKQLVGREVYILCECILPLNFKGLVTSYDIIDKEIVWTINTGGKDVKIGENHPNLQIKIMQ